MSPRLRPGSGGLPRIRLDHPSGSTAEVYLHGAHLTSWIPAGGAEALFLSRDALFRPGTSIRGGVPVVFPQFARLGPLPKHGFARDRAWEWADPDGDPAGATLRLRESPETLAIWPHRFEARLRAELGEDSLSIRLTVANTGAEPWEFTAALHSYLHVEDVERAAVEGLRGVRYRSAVEAVADRPDPDDAVRFGGEVDRVYRDAPREVRLRDEAAGRTLSLRTDGFRDVVVWNPGEALAATLPDLAAGEHRRMVCVEAARVGEPVRLAPGEEWSGEQRLQA